MDTLTKPHCIRKEPAAIYNRQGARYSPLRIVSEKSPPQSTTRRCQVGLALDCIRKEPAAIYNRSRCGLDRVGIVSEKSPPQSTTHNRLGDGVQRLYQKRARRNLQPKRMSGKAIDNCIRKEPAAIYNGVVLWNAPYPIVSEKSPPQSTTHPRMSSSDAVLYQKRARRNLQPIPECLLRTRYCIRKEPAAIYNPGKANHLFRSIVSEKSPPQSTTLMNIIVLRGKLYQKRARRNLQRQRHDIAVAAHCIRKEPAAIYNGRRRRWFIDAIVSEKSPPQSTTDASPPGISAGLYQKRARRNLQQGFGNIETYTNCIRKEPAAIYNMKNKRLSRSFIVSEKSLPQSTTDSNLHLRVQRLYQKRARRNLQSATSPTS